MDSRDIEPPDSRTSCNAVSKSLPENVVILATSARSSGSGK